MSIGSWIPLMTWPIRTWFVKRISITCWLSFATGEFEGAKNNVWGFANRLIRILSVAMRSLVNETRAFLLSVSICLGVGIPILKDAEKKGKILRYMLNMKWKILSKKQKVEVVIKERWIVYTGHH